MKLQILLTLAMIHVAMSLSSVCQSGFILNSQNSCIQPSYKEGCYLYQSQARCHACKYGFTLSNDGSCAINTTANGSCCLQKSSTSSACLSCSSGLFLSNGTCIQIKVWGCTQQDYNGTCLSCGQQFYLRNLKCEKGIFNCMTYTNSSLIICSKCLADFTLFENSCLPNAILGCKSQVNEQCSECYPPFQLNSNKCEVPNCKNHNDFGCTGCECGYYLTSDNKCKEVDQGCIRYQRGICTDCMMQFKLKGGVCQIQGCIQIQGIICTNCKSGYQKSGLGCKMLNCLEWLDGQCQICESGFHYSSGKCIEQVSAQAKSI